MEKSPEKRWGRLGWILATSVAIHLVVLTALLVKLPAQATPEQEQAVNVELVPPPEEKTPEEKAPEEKKEEAQKPPEKPPEQPPEPPKAPDQPAPAQPTAPPPPPPPPAPEPQKPPEEKPQPPAEKPPEQKPPEAKPPEEKPPEQKPPEEKPPEEAPKKEAQKAEPPLPVLRPVFQYGDKDAGPKKAEDGNSASGEAKADEAQPTDEASAEPKQDDPADTPPVEPPASAADVGGQPPADSADKPAAEAAATDAPSADLPPAAASPMPEDIDLPKVGAAETNPAKDGPKSEGEGSASVSLTTEPPKSDVKDQAQPSKSAPKGEQPLKLNKAKKLYSRSDSGGATATTAMDGIPRGVRAGDLCASELQQQLKHAPTVSNVQIIPTAPLPTGTVQQIASAAFRADGRWYNLSFRCEIDADATKVTSFSFAIGDAIPRSQWRRRGFPTD